MQSISDTVTVMINGKAHSNWESYDIDSDLITPADAWQVVIGLNENKVPNFVRPWSPVEVKVGNDTVLTGRVDSIENNIDKNNHSLTLSGRDMAAVLLDCAAPIFSTRFSTLEEIASKVIRPLGISKIKIQADTTRIREKVSVEPGTRAWDVLAHVAEANGLWPWFSPDGTLIIGGPDYNTPPVATLVMRRDGVGNNIESCSYNRNVISHYSHVTILGQTHGTETESGKHDLHATVKDDNADFYRPQIVVDHESDNQSLAKDRAIKLLSDGMLATLELSIVVSGHRIGKKGALWEPGQRIQLNIEPFGISDVYFLIGRRFTKSRNGGTRTELRLKKDGLWMLAAHPHKLKYRRRQNSISNS